MASAFSCVVVANPRFRRMSVSLFTVNSSIFVIFQFFSIFHANEAVSGGFRYYFFWSLNRLEADEFTLFVVNGPLSCFLVKSWAGVSVHIYVSLARPGLFGKT